MNIIKKISPQFLAFLQATGLVVYLILISFFFNFVIPELEDESNEFYAPIVMLLLFIISAVVTSSLVLGRAVTLFWDKKYKKAFEILGWTIGWSILYFGIIVLILLVK